MTRILAVLISVILSYLTYKHIERPFRLGLHGKVKTVGLLIFMIIIGLIGLVTYNEDGLIFRKDAQLQNPRLGDIGHREYHKYIAEHYFLCTPSEIAKTAEVWGEYIRCMQSKPNEKVDIALIGDSHAEHLFVGIAEALPDKNVVFYIKGSPPFLENSDYKKIFETVAKSKSIKTVILTMHWTGRISQVPAGSTLDSELIKVVDFLEVAGKNIYLTDDVPVFPFDPKKCKGSRRFASNSNCRMPYSSFKAQLNIYLDSLEKVVSSHPSVKVLYIGKNLCNSEYCSMVNGNLVLYRDKNHLNINGSSLVGRNLVEENASLFMETRNKPLTN